MSDKILYWSWGQLFALCALLGFIPAPIGFLRWLCTGFSLLFFLPPAWILIRARQSKKKEACKLIRNLSAASLGLTALLLTGNFLSVLGSAAVGQMLHSLLAVVSTPMLCSGFWAMSLFLWACLLTAAGSLAKKR